MDNIPLWSQVAGRLALVLRPLISFVLTLSSYTIDPNTSGSPTTQKIQYRHSGRL